MLPKVISFELNEVPWRVIDHFVASHPESVLARTLPRMDQFETVAEDTALSPWITWPSLHRGVGDEQHTISDFNQDLSEVDRAYPAVWEILNSHGVSTGVFGSLHTHPLPEEVEKHAFYVPHPFASDSRCHPSQYEAFQAFSLSMTRESARNVSTRVPAAQAARFLKSAHRLGIQPRTAMATVMQLIDEKRRSWTKVRRRSFQTILAFDIFMRALETEKPAFTTFFTNHVASAMHRYWAALYPMDYDSFDFTPEWVATYRNEILWTMSAVDRMLARLIAFVDSNPGYELWMSSSMGQAATSTQVAQTQVFLKDVPAFMAAIGFSPDEWEIRPAMLPRVIVAMKNADAAARFEQKLATIQVSDSGFLPWKHLGAGVFRIHPGCLFNVTREVVKVGNLDRPFAELGFANVVIQDSVGQSAYHVPKGSLLVYSPKRQRPAETYRRELSTLEIAPALLKRFGVERPAYMRASSLN